MSEEQEQVVPDEVIAEAKSMGWVPQDKFRGNPDKWVDAAEFVERGEHLMPLLRANNKRLQQDLLTRDAKIDTLTQKLDGALAAVEKLDKHYSEANKRAVEVAKNQLKAELKQAREDDDVDAEQRILGQLDTIREAERDAAKAPVDKKDTSQPSGKERSDLSPEFTSWQQDNPWFGQDKKKTKAVTRIAEDLRDEGSTLQGREFMDECVRVYEEQHTPEAGSHTSKVEGAHPRRPAGSTAKSFASLPAEAKRVCHEDAEDLVGPNKRYKSLEEWEKKYAEIYYSGE
jgi:hypothetical protein